MRKKLTVALLAAVMCIACVPLFSGCKAQKNFKLNVDESGEKYYVFSCSGYTNSIKGEYEIPAYYGEGEDYAPVKEIEMEGLSGTGIVKLTIPATITKIGNAAFAYNYNLREVDFAEGSTLTELPRGAFGYCRSLKKAALPSSVESVGALSFLDCENLTSVTLPENLKIIDERAFEGCISLAEISLPQTLQSLGAMSFYNTALTEITIPASVRDVEKEVTGEDGKTQTQIEYGIGYAAFHSCVQMKKAVVLANVKYINSGVFGFCTALEEVHLPATLKKIEGAYIENGKLVCGHAFHNDESLKRVYFAGTSAEWSAVEIVEKGFSDQGASYNNNAIKNAEVHFGA